MDNRYNRHNRRKYSLKVHIHFLVEYGATDRVCDIVKVVKQETTYYLWQK